jgi:hypothetical protein
MGHATQFLVQRCKVSYKRALLIGCSGVQPISSDRAKSSINNYGLPNCGAHGHCDCSPAGRWQWAGPSDAICFIRNSPVAEGTGKPPPLGSAMTPSNAQITSRTTASSPG